MFVRRATIVRKNRRSVRRPQGAPSPIALSAVTPSSPVPPSPSPSPIQNGSLRPPSDNEAYTYEEEPACYSEDLHYDQQTNLRSEASPPKRYKVQTAVVIDEPSNGSYQNLCTPTTTVSVDNIRRQKGELVRAPTTSSYEQGYDGDYGTAEYGAFLVQLREASKDAESSCEFVLRTIGVFCNSVIVTIFLGILMGIPVTMMSVGVKYLSDCPLQPKVPIYLLVGGCFGLLFLIVVMWRQIQYRRLDSLDTFDDVTDGRGANSSLVTDVILAIFQFVWLILGTVWVFAEWQPLYEPTMYEPSKWCSKNAYIFAVVQIIACYIMLSLALFFTIGLCLCYRCTNVFEPT